MIILAEIYAKMFELNRKFINSHMYVAFKANLKIHNLATQDEQQNSLFLFFLNKSQNRL